MSAQTSDLVVCAWSDPTFESLLLSNPKAALHQFDLDPPDAMDVKVVQGRSGDAVCKVDNEGSAPVGVFVMTETSYRLVSGRAVELVAPLVDGHRTDTEIVAALSGSLSAAEVHYACDPLCPRPSLERGRTLRRSPGPR